MKKVGINELYEMILEEMGVDEARSKNKQKKSNRKRIAKKKAREKLQQDIKTAKKTLEQFINTKENAGLDIKTIKKAILLVLKQKGGLQEATEPADSEDKEVAAAQAAAKELLQQISGMNPSVFAAAAKDLLGKGGTETTQSYSAIDPEKDINELFKKITIAAPDVDFNKIIKDLYSLAVTYAKIVMKSSDASNIDFEEEIAKFPEPVQGLIKEFFDGFTEQTAKLYVDEFKDRYGDLNADVQSSDADSSEEGSFVKLANETISNFSNAYEDKEDGIKLNDLKILKQLLDEVVFLGNQIENLGSLTGNIKNGTILNSIYLQTKNKLEKLVELESSDDQKEEFLSRFDEAIQKIEDNLSKEDFETETEQKFLESLKDRVGSSNLIDQRKNKEITLSRFVSLAENIVEKLEVNGEAFKKAAITAFKNDSVKKIRELRPGVATVEDMASKVVEIAKDYGLPEEAIQKTEEAGKQLIDADTNKDLRKSKLWESFISDTLFPEDKIEALKARFIELKNTRDAAGLLNTEVINKRTLELINQIQSERDLQLLKQYSEDGENTSSYDPENIKATVNRLSNLIKKFFIGGTRANSSPFNSPIMESTDEQSFWNLNKKEEDPPDDFFIKFDEQLNNIARLKVWDEGELDKLGSSLEELGLNFGDDSQKKGLIDAINASAKIISDAAKKSKFYKGLEIIDKQMDKSISGRGLTGFSKEEAEKTYAQLKEKFTERFNEKYKSKYTEFEDTEPTEEDLSPEPLEPEDAEGNVGEEEQEYIDGINRFSREQYNKWVEKTGPKISPKVQDLNRFLSELLQNLVEEIKPEEEEGEVQNEELIRENYENFAEKDASVEKLTSLMVRDDSGNIVESGVPEYLTLRILQSLINSKLYKTIQESPSLSFDRIKSNIKDNESLKEIVKLLHSMQKSMIDIDTELSESLISEVLPKFLRKAAFKLANVFDIKVGQFVDFYIHRFIEKNILPAITKLEIPEGYKLPSDKKDDIPPYPAISIKDILDKLGKAFMKIDKPEEEEPVEEIIKEVDALTIGGLATAAAALTWAFKGRKFSLNRFFEVLTSGEKGVSKKYEQAMEQVFDLNNKQRANLAWYFSKKGNVTKFVNKYLKKHSEYDELMNLEKSRAHRLGQRFKKIKDDIFSKDAEEDNEESANNDVDYSSDWEFDDNTDTQKEHLTLEKALKPIIESVMKEMFII